MADSSWPERPDPRISKLVEIELGPKFVLGSRASGGLQSNVTNTTPTPPNSDELNIGAQRYHEIAQLSDHEITEMLEGHLSEARAKKLEYVGARFEYWALLDSWTILEGLHLAFGIDPELINNKVSRQAFLAWEENRLSPEPLYISLDQALSKDDFLKFYQAIDIATRKYGKQSVNQVTRPPADFLLWAESKKVPICSKLIDAVREQRLHINTMVGLIEELAAANQRVAELESQPNGNSPPPNAPNTAEESTTETENRLRLISVLLDMLTSNSKRFTSQAQLISHVVDNFKGAGIGKTTLEKVFASANKNKAEKINDGN